MSSALNFNAWSAIFQWCLPAVLLCGNAFASYSDAVDPTSFNCASAQWYVVLAGKQANTRQQITKLRLPVWIKCVYCVMKCEHSVFYDCNSSRALDQANSYRQGPVYLPHDKESVWHISMINSHSWLWLYVRHVALSCYIVTENVNGKFIHLERLNMEYFHTRRYGILPSANVIIEEIIYKQ